MLLELSHVLLAVIMQGLIYSFVVMGVYLSSRVIRFDDLTTEGSFGLGGAITATLVVAGFSPWLALIVALCGGALAGATTGILHTRLHMNKLISGLVVTTALFSVCLKLAGSNVALPAGASIFPSSDYTIPIASVLLLCALVALCYWGVKMLLLSEVGLLLKTVGSNSQMLVSLGKSVTGYKIFGLALGNSLTALAGALFVQWNGYFSITGNVGTLVIGLAGLILATMIKPKFSYGLILGAILYQAIFALTIEFELEPIWNNLIKAVLIVLLIQINTRQEAQLKR
jgi:putative tryptophan/tyrosine transport system permease protein